MRRCLLLALALLVVLTACGSTHRSATQARTELGLKACVIRLYFASRATHAQEELVGAKLRQDPRVKRVVFISKAKALAQIKRMDPTLPGPFSVKQNPLPDSFTVDPVALSDLRQLHGSIAGRQWPGVAKLKLDPCRPGP